MAETTDSTTKNRFALLEIDGVEPICALLEGETQCLARRRDWNAKGNGEEEHRRVCLPGETRGQWAADAGTTDGGWAARGMLASNRHCVQRVTLPLGTLIVAFDRSFRQGQSRGPAEVTAGILARVEEEPNGKIEWGLKHRKSGESVEVWTPARGWVAI